MAQFNHNNKETLQCRPRRYKFEQDLISSDKPQEHIDISLEDYDKNMELRGCNWNELPGNVSYIFNRFKYSYCPCNYIHPNFNLFWELRESFNKGIMPDTGGYLDQSAYIINAIQLLNTLCDKLQRDREEKASKDAKKGK